MARKLSPADADDRTRQARGDRRRQEILDAAVELFASKGYRGTGIGALAERVGLTDAGVLYWFGTKERLLREVVAERGHATPDAAERWTLRDLKAVATQIAAEATLGRLYLVLNAENLDAGEPLHDFFVERHRQGLRFLRTLLRNEQARGNVRPEVDVRQVAAEVLGLALGLQIIELTDPTILDAADVFNQRVDQLVEDLRPDRRA